MKLPNVENAIIADSKVRDYLLSFEHPVRRSKAAFFASLGFVQDQWQVLRDQLLALARGQEAEPGDKIEFGQKICSARYDSRTQRQDCFRRDGLDCEIGRRSTGIRYSLSWGAQIMLSAPAFKELDTVVLVRDLPESGLKAGDLGAIVHVHSPEAFEVEFVTAAGGTLALLTLKIADLRAVREDDLLAVRKAPPARGAA